MTSIAERIEAIRARIEASRLQAQLPQGAVALLAVSKTFGPEAVCAAMATGQQDFGENYVQEGVAKQQAVIRALEAYPMPTAAALPGSGLLRPGAQGPRWHFIGPLQSNKTRDVAEHFDWVHTIDRVKIAQRLADQRPETLNPLQVCIQVNIDREPTKSGVDPDAVIATSLAIAEIAADTGRIQLRGLMAIPLPATQPDQQRAAFGRLRSLLKSVNATFQAQAAPKTPLLDTLSMGMSDDLESAIAESDPDLTTWVRIGSAIFGSRPKPTA
nr:Pyridoxal phosphate homeostasis protein [Cupriavidus sp.]